MSKSKGKFRRKSNSSSFADVTINDFADSSKPVYRPKKLVSSVVSVLQTIEKEKSWDEEEEFDFEENEDGNLILVAKAKTVPSKSIALNKQEDFGQIYPLDLWFLLSKYIKPEDVYIFAAICHNSYEVVETIVFWRGLYERFCKNAKNLPEKYQPGNMNRVYGLKCAVVRALFYVYPLFVSRLLSVTWNCSRNNLSTLLRKQCVLQWYEKKKKDWFYFFKFKDNQSPYHCRNQETENNFNLIKMLGDISANPDNNCVVLQIKSSSFIAIPIVLGLSLTSVTKGLSTGFQNHFLRLRFGSSITSSTNNLPDENNCLIDPALDIKILDWWHPLYPQNGKIQLLPNDDY